VGVAAVVAAAGELRLFVDGRDVAALAVADTRAARRRGLLGRDDLDGALMIAPCRSVHTIAMRFAIDVAYVDRDGSVIATSAMRSGRVGLPRWRARSVIEAAQGSFASWNLRIGSVVALRRGDETTADVSARAT
jgi:uncharacterized protein